MQEPAPAPRLIGQYDSPFVRRVGVVLRHYGVAYSHCPWSVFRDAAQVASISPLCRVPVLVLANGEALIDTVSILDYLDEIAPPDRRLIAASGPARRAVLRIAALANGLCDKLVSLVYERAMHDATSAQWLARCEAQVTAVIAALEAECTGGPGAYWFGPTLSHADIALTCAHRFLREAQPPLYAALTAPKLATHAAKCEALPVFAAVTQAFVPP